MEGRKACIGCQGIVMVKNLPVKLFPLNVIPRARCVCKAKWHRFFFSAVRVGLLARMSAVFFEMVLCVSVVGHLPLYSLPGSKKNQPISPTTPFTSATIGFFFSRKNKWNLFIAGNIHRNCRSFQLCCHSPS